MSLAADVEAAEASVRSAVRGRSRTTLGLTRGGRAYDQLDGKVVVDITPLGYLHMGVQEPLGTSFASALKAVS